MIDQIKVPKYIVTEILKTFKKQPCPLYGRFKVTDKLNKWLTKQNGGLGSSCNVLFLPQCSCVYDFMAQAWMIEA